MRAFLATTLLTSLTLAADPHAAAPVAAVTSEAALTKLVEGNKRFASGESTFPRLTQDRRCETFAGGQHPFATILSCSDSRVPPELVFDTGLGDLFVIRVAGNVSDTDEIATIEYGVGHLGTPLIVVMGHAKCGAVTAVVDGAELHGNLAKLVDNIEPAAATAKAENKNLKGAPLVVKAIRANVFQSMQDLMEESADIRTMLKDKKVRLVGAVYDLHSGQVEMLGEHPRQSELIGGAGKPKAPKDSHAEQIKSDPRDDSHAPAKAKPKKTEHADIHEQHGAAPAHTPEAPTAQANVETPSPIKKYAPLSAFALGSLALSAVVLHLMKR